MDLVIFQIKLRAGHSQGPQSPTQNRMPVPKLCPVPRSTLDRLLGFAFCHVGPRNRVCEDGHQWLTILASRKASRCSHPNGDLHLRCHVGFLHVRGETGEEMCERGHARHQQTAHH